MRSSERITSVIVAFANTLSALIALGTLIGLIYTVKLANKQWEEMRAATKFSGLSASAAAESVNVLRDTLSETRKNGATQEDLSRRSLKGSIDNFRQDQRAWVGISSYEVSPIIEGMPIDFKIRLTNSGKTPALHFKGRCARLVLE